MYGLPDGVWDGVVGRIGGEGVEVDKENVCLCEVLEHEVELLDDGHAVVAGELLVPLADDVVEDVIRPLHVNLGGGRGAEGNI